MRCAEDQIKDNIGLGQRLSELRWMGREEATGERESGGERRKAWEEACVAEDHERKRAHLGGESAEGEMEW